MDYNYIGMIFTLPLALAIFHIVSSTISRKLRKLPPGPLPLPLVGNLFHILGDLAHRSVAKISDKYGPITSLQLGQVTTIIISSPSLAKEVLQTQDLAFSSRYIPDVELALDHANYSVIFLPVDSKWRSLRKVMKSSLLSRTRLNAKQSLRFSKVQELIDYINKVSQSGEAMDVGHAVYFCSLNVVFNTMFSKDLVDPYSNSDDEFIKMMREVAIEISKPNLVDYFPFLARFDPQGRRRKVEDSFNRMIKLCRKLIDERIQEMKNTKNNEDDMLGVLLAASEGPNQEIDRAHIEHLCLDIFGGASDTLSVTVEWAMSELLKRPSTMKRAQEELSQVIGRGKHLEETDIGRLPYLNCIFNETLRLHPPNALLVPRTTSENLKVGGYIIPKNAQVLVNAWKIGRDPTAWEDPLIFKPERFLESDVDLRGGDFAYIPFGAGRRLCPGLIFSSVIVQYILGTLLNLFEWKLEDGIVPEQLDMEEGSRHMIHKKNPLKAIPIPFK